MLGPVQDAAAARSLRRLWTWIAIAAVLPSAIMFWGNACFIWNHFLEGPYLQDSGLCSAIIFHNGLFPKNLPAADWRPEYFGIHVSLVESLASLLSYAFPGDRVDWYCLFQGAIYAPLGAVVALLVRRPTTIPRDTTVKDALLVGACSLAFALNGQVIACMEYPHFEIVVPVGICLMLAGLARGHTRLAWLGLVVTASAREDGGLHALSFLAAVLACEYLKRPFPVKRRLVLTMMGAALAASVVAVVVQKTFFQTANYVAAVREGSQAAVNGLDLFRHEYLGIPAFAHIDGASLALRVRGFAEQARFIGLPLLVSLAIAVATRDPRYLLGWVVEIPWLLLNLLANQELKSRFGIYTGFPFVASIFWVGVYAYVRGDSRRRTLSLLAAVALSSTIGSASSAPDAFVSFFRRATTPLPIPRAGILSFSRALRANPDTYGPIFVDHGVAAWALERLPIAARIHPAGFIRDDEPVTPAMLAGRDGLAFFKDGLMAPILARILADSPFSHCGRIARTDVFFCTREGRPLPPEFTPSSVLVARLQTQGTARRDGETIVVGGAPDTGIMAFGANVTLPRGTYAATWSTRTLECPFPGPPRMRFDLAAAGREVAAKAILVPEEPAELIFEVTDPEQTLELRAWSGACTYVIDALTLQRR